MSRVGSAISSAPLDGLVREFRIVAPRLGLLLAALYVNKYLAQWWPGRWIVIPVFLALLMVRARYVDGERLVVRLWQFVGLLSALYSLLHYPLVPEGAADPSGLRMDVLLLVWAGSVVCGGLGLWKPSLAILPAAFLLWSANWAGSVTGLPTSIHIDVQPLTEVSMCIGIGLFVNQIGPTLRRGFRRITSASGDLADEATIRASFGRMLLLIAIAVHLANYYWAFVMKMTLDGPWGAWLTENNPTMIFLVSVDDDHFLFGAYPTIVRWIYESVDRVHLISNFWVLLIQAAAIAAFFMSKRAFLLLLLMFDVMHVSIIFLAGANFWPWIILNVVIAAIVASPDYARHSLAARLVATAFILVAPHFVEVTMLGWYDTGSNNKLYFEAVDDAGVRHPVPTNFFTFYSYSFGHMDYGSPEPETAFASFEPNGGAWTYQLFRAGRRCDVAGLIRPGEAEKVDQKAVTAFVQNYHRLALAVDAKLGGFPYDFYPHHFFVPPSLSSDFRNLDLRRIVAYIYRRESVCVSFDNGMLQRKVISSAEFRIDVDHASSTAGRKD